MPLLLTDTFTASLARLTNEEQKAVKLTVYDLQADPSHPGLRWHKLERTKDKHFSSVSANMDLRIIVHRYGETKGSREQSLMACYVDHHDKAYRWAQNRVLETHPTTGAAQIVEVIETIRTVEQIQYIQREVIDEVMSTVVLAKADLTEDVERPLAQYDSSWLMQYGVPEQWVEPLKLATQEGILELFDHLPQEAAEAVLSIATGTIPPVPQAAPVTADPFQHPDALRRFRTIENVEELTAALDLPFDKWRIFLHPDQRALVSKTYGGPARVAGSAGTGKTIVALHRAAHLVRSDATASVLLTTFSDALANALNAQFRTLVKSEPRLAERVQIESLRSVATRLYRARGGEWALIEGAQLRKLVEEVAANTDIGFASSFLWQEFTSVVDAWQVYEWDTYRTVPRVGRGKSLNLAKRTELWSVFEQVLTCLHATEQVTINGMFAYLSDHFADPQHRSPYTHIVVDEAQDIGVSQLRFLAALIGGRPDGLFFAGDLGQRIFQAPFSWSSLGVDVRGRSNTLRINYRTSHQIRQQADRLLSPEVSDVDGNQEIRGNAQSVFNGPSPTIFQADIEEAEQDYVGAWIKARIAEGLEPQQIAVFVRSEKQLDRARAAITTASAKTCELDENLRTRAGYVTLSTMHLAKGLEFRAVVVMAVDEDVIPDPDRIQAMADLSQLPDLYETERHLLYVACTRAREHLLVTSGGEASEFLSDLVG